MQIHVTDLPLETVEILLIAGLALGMYLLNRSLKREKTRAEQELRQSNDELKHLRRTLDRILMVDRGYARPGESLDADEEAPKSPKRPTRLR